MEERVIRVVACSPPPAGPRSFLLLTMGRMLAGIAISSGKQGRRKLRVAVGGRSEREHVPSSTYLQGNQGWR